MTITRRVQNSAKEKDREGDPSLVDEHGLDLLCLQEVLCT